MPLVVGAVCRHRDSAVTAFVAFLRGINLGARNKVSMAKLRETAGAIGLEGVRTHLQSGNLLFCAPAARGRRIGPELEKALDGATGVNVRVLVRTEEELASVVSGNPWPQLSGTKLHVFFLAETPKPSSVQKLDPQKFSLEEFEVRGKHIYVSYPHGMGRSKLGLAYFEKALLTVGTARNWNTVTKVLDLMAKS
jgi:uncharacterized protein (DUF1697 family)